MVKYIADIWSPEWQAWQLENVDLLKRGARLGTDYPVDGAPRGWQGVGALCHSA